MTKVKNLLLTILLLCGTTIWGNNGLRISGRIKVLKPTTLQIKDMNEGVVLSLSLIHIYTLLLFLCK